MRSRNIAAFQIKERVMTKIRKFRLIRLGDAKKLTRGVGDIGVEINLQPGRDAG